MRLLKITMYILLSLIFFSLVFRNKFSGKIGQKNYINKNNININYLNNNKIDKKTPLNTEKQAIKKIQEIKIVKKGQFKNLEIDIKEKNIVVFKKNNKKLTVVYREFNSGSISNMNHFIGTLWDSLNLDLISNDKYLLIGKINDKTDGRGGYFYRSNGGKKIFYIKLKSEILNMRDVSFSVFIHEIGHFLDLGLIEGKINKKEKSFTEFGKDQNNIDDYSNRFYSLCRIGEKIQNNNCKKEGFFTIYSKTDTFEDFAETFTTYVFFNTDFRKHLHMNSISAQKFKFFDTLFNNNSYVKKLYNFKVKKENKLYKDLKSNGTIFSTDNFFYNYNQ